MLLRNLRRRHFWQLSNTTRLEDLISTCEVPAPFHRPPSHRRGTSAPSPAGCHRCRCRPACVRHAAVMATIVDCLHLCRAIHAAHGNSEHARSGMWATTRSGQAAAPALPLAHVRVTHVQVPPAAAAHLVEEVVEVRVVLLALLVAQHLQHMVLCNSQPERPQRKQRAPLLPCTSAAL